MSRQTKTTINTLVEELHGAAGNVVGTTGSTPSQDALERLSMAVIALENAVIVRGVWRLECFLCGDLRALAKLIKRSAKLTIDGR